MNIYIYCVGLYKDGGLNILDKFLKHRASKNILILDSRLKKKYLNEKIIKVSENLIFRFFHLLYLSQKVKREDHFLFLNGIPPIIKFKCKTSIIFQNANLFREFYKIGYFKWFFSKDFLRYIAFLIGKNKIDNWYVLSPVAKTMVSSKLKNYTNIKVLNILDEYQNQSIRKISDAKYDFIYPASYMEHKNHQLLIESLIFLSKKKIYPSVLLTLDNNSIKKLKMNYLNNKYNLKLYNYFEPEQIKFIEIYKKCKSLIYMSSNETIGLPILEAYKYGLTIIAPNLNYSQQFLTPHLLFDLNIKRDLSDVIEKFLNNNFTSTKKNLIQKDLYLNNSIKLNEFYSKIL